MLHALTVDVEDWPQSTLDTSLPITERAVRNTHSLLDLFERHRVKGTFFILGLLAEKFPRLVQEIDSAGHEVASHGHSHLPVFRIGPQAFHQELKRSCGLLEELTGKPVLGYRAPDFSITENSLWALELIAQHGLAYDSSIFPIRMRRYGIHNFPRTIHTLPSGIVEAPLSSILWAKRRWPVAGGGYFRLLPGRLTQWAIQKLQDEGQPAIVYLHPYEIDPHELNELPHRIPWKTRLTQGLNRRFVQPRLQALFQNFRFGTLSQVIQHTLDHATQTTAGCASAT